MACIARSCCANSNVIASGDRALLSCAGGGIGDSLVASVVARALRTHFGAVDALTLPGHRAVLERVAEIDAVLLDAGSERDVVQSVREREYAACIVTWATARTARIARAAQIPIRVGQSRRLYSGSFTHQVAVRSEHGDVISPWSQILLDYARAIDCDSPDTRPRLTLRESDETEAQRALLAAGIGDAPFGIVHPTCGAAPTRPLWPMEGWIALAHELRERYAIPLLVSGAPADAPLVAPLIQATHLASIVGRTSLGAFAAIARRARFMVVMHSGPMHVAAAMGTATVGIFPLQADFPDRWAPLGERVAIVRASYPCGRGDLMETCSHYSCIAKLDLPRILAALESVLV